MRLSRPRRLLREPADKKNHEFQAHQFRLLGDEIKAVVVADTLTGPPLGDKLGPLRLMAATQSSQRRKASASGLSLKTFGSWQRQDRIYTEGVPSHRRCPVEREWPIDERRSFLLQLETSCCRWALRHKNPYAQGQGPTARTTR